MLKNASLAWLVAAVAVVVAVVFGVRADRATQRAISAEARVNAKANLEQAAVGLQSARFIRLDKATSTVTYSVPEQTEVNGETFVNYKEQTALLSGEAEVYGLPVAGSAEMQDVPEGTPIALRTSTGADGKVTIDALYFIH